MRISDWSSELCPSDLLEAAELRRQPGQAVGIVDPAGFEIGRGERAAERAGVAADAAEVDPFDIVAGIQAEAEVLRRDVQQVHRGVLGADDDLAEPAGDGKDGFVDLVGVAIALALRSEEHTSELQSLMSTSYAVGSLKKTKK